MSSLPIILISARSHAETSYIMSELVDNEPDDVHIAEGRVWRITNKYYTADVCVRAATDDVPPPAAIADRIEGHVVYLAEDECTAEAAERRAGAGRGASVRVLAAAAPCLGTTLRSWAARRRYAPVPLTEPVTPEDADEEYGADAVRAALHAHAWPGLQRHAVPGRTPGPASDHAWGAALEMLAGGAAAMRTLPPGGEARRAAAVALVEMVTRALPDDLDDL